MTFWALTCDCTDDALLADGVQSQGGVTDAGEGAAGVHTVTVSTQRLVVTLVHIYIEKERERET